jgi:periplasmic protein TonB
MVIPANSAERPPAPSTSTPRASMALSLALHGLAVLLLCAAGAAGSAGSEEPALLVELALVAPSSNSADTTETSDATSEMVVELPPSEEPPPVDWSMLKPIELVPSPEPPPVDVSELKPVEPPKPPPPPRPQKPQQQPAARQASPKAEPAQNFGSAADARQAAAGFLPTTVVWEGKPRYRHPPTPPAYPPRAVELNQQGEVVLRVRLDPQGAAVEILVHRPSGHQLLDRAAVAAVRSWHFLPAMRDGRPVSAWVEIPVRFHLR